jgi:competence protein ComEC
VIWSILGGRFAGRVRHGLLAMGIITAWLLAPLAANTWRAHYLPFQLHMVTVGDGSCFVVQSGGETMMFDCGSAGYPDITTVAVEPALHAMGIMHVPTLVLSHPDSDHFSGTPELLDRFGVQHVMVTQTFVDIAREQPNSAPAYVLDVIHQRGVKLSVIARGWQGQLGQARITALWPPAGAAYDRQNDGSIMLRFDVAGRRVMLCGDVQQQAMGQMLGAGTDLRSDIVELPHHGSFVEIAPVWLDAVDPQVVLQSSGPARLRDDRWAAHMEGRQRYITARHGMTSVRIDRKSRISVQTWR